MGERGTDPVWALFDKNIFVQGDCSTTKPVVLES